MNKLKITLCSLVLSLIPQTAFAPVVFDSRLIYQEEKQRENTFMNSAATGPYSYSEPLIHLKKKEKTYIVTKGDTLWDIAKAKCGNPLKYHFLASYNGIENPDKIYEGTSLNVDCK